jgi:hypothetical protein
MESWLHHAMEPRLSIPPELLRSDNTLSVRPAVILALFREQPCFRHVSNKEMRHEIYQHCSFVRYDFKYLLLDLDEPERRQAVHRHNLWVESQRQWFAGGKPVPPYPWPEAKKPLLNYARIEAAAICLEPRCPFCHGDIKSWFPVAALFDQRVCFCADCRVEAGKRQRETEFRRKCAALRESQQLIGELSERINGRHNRVARQTSQTVGIVRERRAISDGSKGAHRLRSRGHRESES